MQVLKKIADEEQYAILLITEDWVVALEEELNELKSRALPAVTILPSQLGSLGMGNLLDANGLARALEVVLQLRGNASSRQLEDISIGLAQSWRGVPTTSGAVAIFGN